MGDLRAELERVREELLDLSLRNPLLNYRAYGRSTVETTEEVPREVYRRLVLQGRKMAFLPSDEDTEAADGEDSVLWKLPPPGADLKEEHTDRFLQTPHTDRDLQKRLFHMDNKARTLVEDAGYNALHLAVGFLTWRPEADDELRQAPLILIPVQLEREQATSSFKLQWTGQDLDTNLSLKIRLEDRGITLSDFAMPEDAEGVYEYLNRVRERVSGMPDWSGDPTVALGFFKFTNLSMYKDLDPEEWPEDQQPHEHDLVRRILDPTQADDESPLVDVDEASVDPVEANHVLDADPSQAAVIEAVKRGQSLVVEGPPGTGKSQTIVNLIAELVAEGKQVLFVSEKKAALEVVHGKLDAVGLGDFCLELHSHKANKAETLNELQRVAFQEPAVDRRDDDLYRDLAETTDALDGYVDAMRKPVRSTGLAPFELIAQRQEAVEHFAPEEPPIVELPDALDIDAEAKREAFSLVEDLVEAIDPVWPVDEHPWRGTDPGTVLPRKRRRVEAALDDAIDATQALQGAVEQVEQAANLAQAPGTPRQAREAVDAIEHLVSLGPVDPVLALDEAWDEPHDADGIVDRVSQRAELADTADRFRSRAPDLELDEIREEYRERSSSLFRWLSPSFWQIRSRVHDLYEDDVPSSRATILEDLQALTEYQHLTDRLEAVDETARELFGRCWQGPDSDPAQLSELAEWVETTRRHVDAGVVTEASLQVLDNEQDRERLDGALDAVRAALASYREAIAELAEPLGADPDAWFGEPLADANTGTVLDRVQMMRASTGAIDDWATYAGIRDDVQATFAAPICTALRERRIEPEDAIAALEGNLADTLLEHAFQTREALGGFAGDLHEKRVERFRELDEEGIQRNRETVRQSLWDHRPDLVQGASSSSEAGVLVREFRKKQRHLSIRKLMVEAGSLVQDLKPCFMMSPLSVAKYLDPQKVHFDVVIFDEASQVRPQDALGAILRGDQLVVMGDPNQLPPTSFFEAVVERDEDETNVGSIVDLQSILDACEGTFPRRTLRWHYRSRHESLITVSNSEFYDDRLVVYPSPYQGHAELGLDLEHLEDTMYDRGGSRQNRGEARAVAEAALDHFRNHPDQSLGIGTFSSAQEEAIREEIEILRRKHPEMDPYVSEDEDTSPFGHEHFMIKNLETIQGDERDVIFVSVGYGFDEEGTLTQNFGPLNHEGGWRRLNVLITRARNRCVVFSNFTSDDLDVKPKTPRGVRGLARFLEYAEKRDAEGIEPSRGTPDSPLDRAVKTFLEDEGYTVHANVGSAGFRVDLAVVDPDDPERYLLGVELDGPGYLDAPVARERDRLRRDVLEERGWSFTHVWAADWYKSPETVQRRLLDAIDEARQARPDEAPVETRAWDPSTNGHEASSEDETEDPAEEPIEERLVAIEDYAKPYDRVDELDVPAWDADAAREQVPEFVAWIGDAVERLVEVEAPIHEDLIVNRLRDAWGLERAHATVKQAVEAGIERALSLGNVHLEEGFVWIKPRDRVLPRHRAEDDVLEISLIADAEIQGAVDLVLDRQRATPPDEIASQVAGLLGFQRKGQRIEARVEAAIQRGIETGDYGELEDGRVRALNAAPTVEERTD
jgi:DNA polymerase III delta prime subunit